MEQNPIREQLGPRRALDYSSLDAWRGLACLAVVFFHCWVEMGMRLYVRPTAFSWSRFGFLGVQIFFVISGFCIAVAAHSAWHKKSWGKFAWARVTRIYPPLWGGLLLVMALKVIGSRMGAKVVDGDVAGAGPWYYLANFSLLNYALHPPAFLLRVAWSLCYEVAFYAIVFAALMAFSRAKSANWMLNALHALSLGIMAWLTASFYGLTAPPFPLDLWPQFGMGVLVFDLLLAKEQKEEKRERFLWTVGLAFATLVGAFLMKCWGSWELRLHLFLPFAVSFGFAFILWYAYRFEGSVSRWNFVKLMRSIGTFSYSIYLVHFTLIMALSRGIFTRVKFLPWFVEVAFQVIFAVGSGWIFYQLIEKPSQKLKRVRK